MKTTVFAAMLAFSVIASVSCVSPITSQYGTTTETDRFNDNRTIVTMKGGVIDIAGLGIAADAAELDPYVVRSAGNTVLSTGVKFHYEMTGSPRWLHVREGSTATFLLDNGEGKVVARALAGKHYSSPHSRRRGEIDTYYESAYFDLTPGELRRIAYATSVEVRVRGTSSHIDFPREGCRVPSSYLPNVRRFYEAEVRPYSK